LLLVTDTNGSENDEKSLPGILGQEKMEVEGIAGRNGGRDRVRTCDLVVANDALSQLSYTPTSSNF
jgi:hypothetical protein